MIVRWYDLLYIFLTGSGVGFVLGLYWNARDHRELTDKLLDWMQNKEV